MRGDEMYLTPYILFDGNCEEAMAFYQSCIGGELTIQKVSESPLRDQVPPSFHDRVLNARLHRGAVDLSASDWLHPTRLRRPGNSVCLYIRDGTNAALRVIFDRLAVGSDETVRDDLRDMPFGSYGALTDRYGVRWMFQGRSAAE